MNINLDDLPDDVIVCLKQRAAIADVAVGEYVADVLIDHARNARTVPEIIDSSHPSVTVTSGARLRLVHDQFCKRCGEFFNDPETTSTICNRCRPD